MVSSVDWVIYHSWVLASGVYRGEQEALSASSFKVGEMLQGAHHGTCKEGPVQHEWFNNSHPLGQYKEDKRGERRLKHLCGNYPSSPLPVVWVSRLVYSPPNLCK